MSMPSLSQDQPRAPLAAPRRLAAIDVARGVALIAMAIYHFTWDLGFFGYIDPSTAGTGGWKIFARLIASSFLFLAGVGLVLGHTPQFRPRAFGIRLAKIALAALVISVATYVAMPDSFIFFGILHGMAAASIVGVVLLRAPAPVTALAALFAFLAPMYLRSPAFDSPAFWWLGLSETLPRSNDYVPIFPWLAPFLLGMAVTRLALQQGWFRWFSAEAPTRLWKRTLATAGRHSLVIYLVHQPLLIALVYLATWIVPPAVPDPVQSYLQQCVAVCSQNQGQPVCQAFCECTLAGLLNGNLFNDMNAGNINMTNDPRIVSLAGQCSAEAGVGTKE